MTIEKKLPKKGQKVFSTKYALTAGIEEVRVMSSQIGTTGAGYVYYKEPNGPSYGTQLCAKDWHLTRKEAAKAAALKAEARVRSLLRAKDKVMKLLMQFKAEAN